ncbi:HdeD family acid-resistance protein [Streptomyces sp. CA-106131]|uniref:HdeD family acid-resistance protein n=1 Tax=Streptomyces sp. CA-106131 TaxID=3240045 RepID=UPI003D89C1C7
MAKTTATPLFWRGLLAVIVGVVSVAWPDITLGVFVIAFSVYAFLAAGTDFLRAVMSDRVGPVLGYVFLAVLSLAAALGALTWPSVTALVLTIWVAAWALVTGVLEVALSFRHGENAGERAMWVLGGLVSVVLGIVLAARPDIGAVTLASVFGIFSILYGAFVLVLSARVRRAAHAAGRLVGSQ